MIGDDVMTTVLMQHFSSLVALETSFILSDLATLHRRTERDVFFITTQGIVQLVQRYRNGIQGHLRATVQDLLRQYLKVRDDKECL